MVSQSAGQGEIKINSRNEHSLVLIESIKGKLRHTEIERERKKKKGKYIHILGIGNSSGGALMTH